MAAITTRILTSTTVAAIITMTAMPVMSTATRPITTVAVIILQVPAAANITMSVRAAATTTMPVIAATAILPLTAATTTLSLIAARTTVPQTARTTILGRRMGSAQRLLRRR